MRTVYAWCQSGDGTDMQVWMAMADDGEVIASHLSSSRAWGAHDVGPTGVHASRYATKFGDRYMDDLDYRIAPPGEHGIPDEVLKLNQELRQEKEASV